VGNRFVAGNFERAANRAGRTNDLFGHARILACGQNTCELTHA
jgi:hypothetical protein